MQEAVPKGEGRNGCNSWKYNLIQLLRKLLLKIVIIINVISQMIIQTGS